MMKARGRALYGRLGMLQQTVGGLLLLWLLLGVSAAHAQLPGPPERQQEAWQVTEIYIATMGYAPDAEGLDYWVNNIRTMPEWTPLTVAQSFFDQPLVQEKYPFGQDYGVFIDALYQNIFGRAPDPGGYGYWLDELNSGRVQRNQMIIALLNGGWDNPDAAADMARFGNRVRVGLAFAEHQRMHGIQYTRLDFLDQALLRALGEEVLVGVGASVESYLQALDRIPELLSALTGGGTDQIVVVTSAVGGLDAEPVTLHAVTPRSLADSGEVKHNLLTELQYRLLLGGMSYTGTEVLIREYFGIYAAQTLSLLDGERLDAALASMVRLADTLGETQLGMLASIVEDVRTGRNEGYAYRAALRQAPAIVAEAVRASVGAPISLRLDIGGTLNDLYEIEWEEYDAWQIDRPSQPAVALTFNAAVEQNIEVMLRRKGEISPVERAGITLAAYQTSALAPTALADKPGYTDLGNGIVLPATAASSLASSGATQHTVSGSNELARIEATSLNLGSELVYAYDPLYVRDPMLLQLEYDNGAGMQILFPSSVDYDKYYVTFQIPDSIRSARSGSSGRARNAVSKNHYVTVNLSSTLNAKAISDLLDGRRTLFELIAKTYIQDQKSVKELVDFIYSPMGAEKLRYVLEGNGLLKSGGYDEFAQALNMVVASESMVDLISKPSWTGEGQWWNAMRAYREWQQSCEGNFYSADSFMYTYCSFRVNAYVGPVRKMHNGLSAWLGRPGLTQRQQASLKTFKGIASLAGSFGTGAFEKSGTVAETFLNMVNAGGGTLISMSVDPNLPGYLWGVAFDLPKAIKAASIAKSGLAFLPGIAVNFTGNFLAQFYEDSMKFDNLKVTAPIILAVGYQAEKLNTNIHPYGDEFWVFRDKYFNNQLFGNIYDYLGGDTGQFLFGKYDPNGRLENIFLEYTGTGKLSPDERRAAQRWFKAVFGSKEEVERFNAISDLARLLILLSMLDAQWLSDAEAIKTGPGALLLPEATYKASIKSEYKKNGIFNSVQNYFGFGQKSSRATVGSGSAHVHSLPNYQSASDLFGRMGFTLNEQLLSQVRSGSLRFEGLTVTIGGFPLVVGVDGALASGSTPTAVQQYRHGPFGADRFTASGSGAVLPLANLIPALTQAQWNDKMLAFEVSLEVSQNGKRKVLTGEYLVSTVTDMSRLEPAPSERGDVTGRVLDQQGNPVSGVTVRLLPVGLTTITDQSGMYRFLSLVKGNYRVEVLSSRDDVAPVVDHSTVPEGVVSVDGPDDANPFIELYDNAPTRLFTEGDGWSYSSSGFRYAGGGPADYVTIREANHPSLVNTRLLPVGDGVAVEARVSFTGGDVNYGYGVFLACWDSATAAQPKTIYRVMITRSGLYRADTQWGLGEVIRNWDVSDSLQGVNDAVILDYIDGYVSFTAGNFEAAGGTLTAFARVAANCTHVSGGVYSGTNVAAEFNSFQLRHMRWAANASLASPSGSRSARVISAYSMHQDPPVTPSTLEALLAELPTTNGAAPDAPLMEARLDTNHQRALFLSRATNLVRGVQNGARHLYSLDLGSGVVQRLSETTWGEPANGDTVDYDLAVEAGKLVFRIRASNLENGPGLYLVDLETGLREALVTGLWFDKTDPQAERPALDAQAGLLGWDQVDASGQRQIHTLDLTSRATRQETPLDAFTLDACCVRISSDGRYLAWQERGQDGEVWLRVIDDATGRHATVEWPEGVDTDAQSVRIGFADEGRSLHWLSRGEETVGAEAETGAQAAETPDAPLHIEANPVFAPAASLH